MYGLIADTEDKLAAVPDEITAAKWPASAAPLTPMQLMQRALEAGNLELVERMMTLQERAEAGAARKAFSAAMCAAQAEMRPISQDAANPQTRSHYASFANLDRALRPIYSKHGFSISYDTGDAPENCVRVIAIVSAHGFERTHHLDIPADGKGAKGNDVMTKTHATMAAITYGRRGLLKMIFNVAEGTDLDDDGNAASRIVQQPIEDTGEIISPAQVDVLLAALKVREMPKERLLAWIQAGGADRVKRPEVINLEFLPVHIFQTCLDKVRQSGDPQ